MARVLGLLPAALVAARGGMSFSAFQRQQVALGEGARTSEMRALWRYAQTIVNRAHDDPFAEQSAIPAANELTPWPTKAATGIKQVVTLIYRDKTTGTITHTYYNVVSPQGVARSDAIAKAISAYSDHTEEYKQDLIGAVHTGAYNLQPFEE